MKKILLSLLVFLTVLPQAVLAGKKNEPARLTVMSYNIRNGEAKDGTNSWEFRYPASAMMLDDQKPDIFGVQEAYLYQVKYLTEFPGYYKSVGVGRDDGKTKGEYMSIFYNKKTVKMLKWGTFWLSETPDEPSFGWDAACRRTATWALLKDKKSGKKFYYVNTHLDHKGWEARRNGLKLIVDYIDKMNPKGYPMVLTGDFNMTPDRPEFEELNKRMQDAREVAPITDHLPTFNGWGKVDKDIIDYIFIKGWSKCISYETVRKPYMDRKFISDHYPIKAVLEF
ncbi:MAG: endonuclease/exonuclease/phosphatase family protein [Bacteroidales bacterium]|jgi:endonuclease/exonuclease/phosphatase family metal-dependent hydrolase|nr:endonuclease/exonuclease/phosphatase family protein [Bacteroidales bacterium]